MYYNKFYGMGNCAADPEIRELGGKKAASFRIGISERFKNSSGQVQEHTEWVNIVAWGKTAEAVEKHVKKGTMVFVEGKLQTRQWEDRNGAKRYTTEISASNIQFDKSRSARDGDEQQGDDYDF